MANLWICFIQNGVVMKIFDIVMDINSKGEKPCWMISVSYNTPWGKIIVVDQLDKNKNETLKKIGAFNVY